MEIIHIPSAGFYTLRFWKYVEISSLYPWFFLFAYFSQPLFSYREKQV